MKFNCVRFIKVGLVFDWFEVEDWDDVDNDIKINYCSSSMNEGKENDVVIEWNSKGGMVYLKDDEENKWEFECGYGRIE